jgi:formate hydrogenlyase transcriptional activator
MLPNCWRKAFRSLCYLPLISNGRNLGTFGLSWTTDISLPSDDTVFLSQIAAQVALALDNTRAYEENAKLKEKLSKERLYVKGELNGAHPFGEVIGKSQSLSQVLKQVEIAAPGDANVLILGETGTGKELIAQALHRVSARRMSTS